VTTIYAVSSGSYSDYSVCGVFSSKENAEIFMRSIPDKKYNDIEEYTLDPIAPEARAGMVAYRVVMRRDGQTVEAEPYWQAPSPGEIEWRTRRFDHEWDMVQMRTIKAEWVDLPKGEWEFATSMWARDADHAIKIANERRIQKIALEGVTE
jgi:hypothetical protein